MNDDTQLQPNNDNNPPDGTQSVVIAQVEQIEAAVQALSEGASFEQLALQYGENWRALENEIRLANNLRLAGADFHQNLPAFNKAALLGNIHSQLAQVHAVGIYAADSSGQMPPLGDTNFDHVATVVPFSSRKRKVITVSSWAWPVRIAAILILFLMLSLSFVAAAQASGPGDLLYGAKLSLEHTREFFAFSDEAKTDAQVQFCSNRLQEIEVLKAKGQLSLIPEVTTQYSNTLNNILQNKQKLPSKVTTELIEQRVKLQALNNSVTQPATKTQIDQVLNQLNKIQSPAAPVTAPTTSPSGAISATSTISDTSTIAGASSTPTLTQATPTASDLLNTTAIGINNLPSVTTTPTINNTDNETVEDTATQGVISNPEKTTPAPVNSSEPVPVKNLTPIIPPTIQQVTPTASNPTIPGPAPTPIPTPISVIVPPTPAPTGVIVLPTPVPTTLGVIVLPTPVPTTDDSNVSPTPTLFPTPVIIIPLPTSTYVTIIPIIPNPTPTSNHNEPTVIPGSTPTPKGPPPTLPIVLPTITLPGITVPTIIVIPVATPTPVPIVNPTPEPVATATPTDEPTPVRTPKPTKTPKPTRTPKPTNAAD